MTDPLVIAAFGILIIWGFTIEARLQELRYRDNPGSHPRGAPPAILVAPWEHDPHPFMQRRWGPPTECRCGRQRLNPIHEGELP